MASVGAAVTLNKTPARRWGRQLAENTRTQGGRFGKVTAKHTSHVARVVRPQTRGTKAPQCFEPEDAGSIPLDAWHGGRTHLRLPSHGRTPPDSPLSPPAARSECAVTVRRPGRGQHRSKTRATPAARRLPLKFTWIGKKKPKNQKNHLFWGSPELPYDSGLLCNLMFSPDSTQRGQGEAKATLSFSVVSWLAHCEDPSHALRLAWQT